MRRKVWRTDESFRNAASLPLRLRFMREEKSGIFRTFSKKVGTRSAEGRKLCFRPPDVAWSSELRNFFEEKALEEWNRAKRRFHSEEGPGMNGEALGEGASKFGSELANGHNFRGSDESTRRHLVEELAPSDVRLDANGRRVE